MRGRICLAVLAMGFSGLVAQILLLREFLIVLSGNEFSIGIVLAHWLILEAFGAFVLGRLTEKSRHALATFVVLTILFLASLFIAVLSIRALKGALGVSIGESIPFLPMFGSSFLILAPVSVLHGALFTAGCQIYAIFSGQEASPAGVVYAYETIGTLIGGIVCTYLFIPYLHTIEAFAWLALLNLIVCLVLLLPYGKTGLAQRVLRMGLGGLILASGYLLSTGHADRLHWASVVAQWQGHNVVHYQNSQYGNICVVENEGQYTFFQDGVPGLTTPIPDIAYVEEFVHLPLLAHPEPRRLLILSGGAGGVIHEALKHPTVETIEYAELDPLLIELLGKFPTPLTESELKDSRVKIRYVDGRLLLKTTQETYDVILVGITEPSNLQTNRFFTREFFALARARLREGGILVFGLPGSLTYLSDELSDLNSSVYHTARSVFPYVRAVPGGATNLFLSSDSQGITTLDRGQIIERLSQRNIGENARIPWHIEQKVHPGWQTWFSGFIEGRSQRVNADFTPVAVFYSIAHWNALFAPPLRGLFRALEQRGLWVGLFVFVVLLLCFLWRAKGLRSYRAGIPLAISTTGFAGMLFDLMLIFAFQSVHGYVFSWIGLLVAFFMAGAAGGAWLVARVVGRMKNALRFFAGIELAILCFAIGCPGLVLAAHAYPGDRDVLFLSNGAFLGLCFIGGLLIGSQFPLANRLAQRDGASLSRTAGSLYAADLLGGWLGGITGAVVLLPVLGLVGAGITVASLKLISLTVIAARLDERRRGGRNEG